MSSHYPYCATCRIALCAACACGVLHEEHYLLSRPFASPCGTCQDAQAYQAFGLEEEVTSVLTQTLHSLQMLFLYSFRGGGPISAHCDTTGKLPLDLAFGLLQDLPGGSSSSSSELPVYAPLASTIRALQRCPMFTCTRVSGSAAFVGLHHPRAHEVLALAAPHAAYFLGCQEPLAGAAARSLSECGLLPQTLHAFASGGAVPLWSPQASGASPGAAATASPHALLPPPRLPGAQQPPPASAAASPPIPLLQRLKAASSSSGAPLSRTSTLCTVPEVRAWVKGLLSALHKTPCAPGEIAGVCAIALTLQPPSGMGGKRASIISVALASNIGGSSSECVSFALDELAASCSAAAAARRGKVVGGEGGGAAGGGEGSGLHSKGEAFPLPPPLGTLTLLHALLPLLLHPALLKAVHAPHSTLNVFAAEAGMHAVNTLCLDFVAEEVGRSAEEEEGGGGGWSLFIKQCKQASANAAKLSAGSSSSSCSLLVEAANDLLALTLKFQSMADTLSSLKVLSAVHRAWLRSQLVGLSPCQTPITSPPAAAASGLFPATRKRPADALLMQSSFPLTTAPWYLECQGCRIASAGHFIVDCPAWMSDKA